MLAHAFLAFVLFGAQVPEPSARAYLAALGDVREGLPEGTRVLVGREVYPEATAADTSELPAPLVREIERQGMIVCEDCAPYKSDGAWARVRMYESEKSEQGRFAFTVEVFQPSPGDSELSFYGDTYEYRVECEAEQCEVVEKNHVRHADYESTGPKTPGERLPRP